MWPLLTSLKYDESPRFHQIESLINKTYLYRIHRVVVEILNDIWFCSQRIHTRAHAHTRAHTGMCNNSAMSL